MGFSVIAYSENIQMYLVNIRREQQGDKPLPLPALAELLGISTPSVNEMVKKLEEEGFVRYVPYAGVQLTPEGTRLAEAILRKHRLWEVFLVEKLGFEQADAHQAACRLEHATPDQLAESLADFLEDPRENPRGEPIPGRENGEDGKENRTLAGLTPGETGVVADLRGQPAGIEYLKQSGIEKGRRVTLLAGDPRSILVQVEDRKIVLARKLAGEIMLRREAERTNLNQ